MRDRLRQRGIQPANGSSRLFGTCEVSSSQHPSTLLQLHCRIGDDFPSENIVANTEIEHTIANWQFDEDLGCNNEATDQGWLLAYSDRNMSAVIIRHG